MRSGRRPRAPEEERAGSNIIPTTHHNVTIAPQSHGNTSRGSDAPPFIIASSGSEKKTRVQLVAEARHQASQAGLLDFRAQRQTPESR